MSLETCRAPWTLTYVYCRWKMVALGLPKVWSYIDLLDYGCHPMDREKWADPERLHYTIAIHNYIFLLGVLLGRSADRPLIFCLGCSPSLDFALDEPTDEGFVNEKLQSAFLRQLLGHCGRWQDVTIVGFPGCGGILKTRGPSIFGDGINFKSRDFANWIFTLRSGRLATSPQQWPTR